ncbi:MAG: hypothetical protein ACRC8P_01690 [Spiroplasma sp.]
MARNVYKVNKNKLSNNKSELDSKTDSVVLTNFKAIEENVFVEEMKENNAESVYKLSNNKSELDSKTDSVVLTNFKAIEEDVFVEEMKETQEIKNEGCLGLILQSLSRKFEKFREKNGMIKEIKDLEQSLEKIKNERKDLLEFYTRIVKIQELEKAELEKAVKDYNFLETSYNLENPSTQLEYDEMQDPYVNESEEELESTRL